MILCFQELCCLDFMILVLITTFGIPHFGIMLPRFHVPCFNYGIWILELCCLDSMFLFLFTVCAFSIMELCCLDLMILVLFTTFAFCILELCCLDSMFLLSFTVFKINILHSPFWNYVASIPCSFFFQDMCILELCRLDSIITDYLRTVFGIQRIYYTVIMLPRFHRVRTRRPGNSLWPRLKREKLEPISRIIWKKSPSKWV